MVPRQYRGGGKSSRRVKRTLPRVPDCTPSPRQRILLETYYLPRVFKAQIGGFGTYDKDLR